MSKTPAPKTAAAPKGAKKTDAGADVATIDVPAPANRFADRFAPPKPPARGASQVDETPRVAAKGDPKLANAWKTNERENKSRKLPSSSFRAWNKSGT